LVACYSVDTDVQRKGLDYKKAAVVETAASNWAPNCDGSHPWVRLPVIWETYQRLREPAY